MTSKNSLHISINRRAINRVEAHVHLEDFLHAWVVAGEVFDTGD